MFGAAESKRIQSVVILALYRDCSPVALNGCHGFVLISLIKIDCSSSGISSETKERVLDEIPGRVSAKKRRNTESRMDVICANLEELSRITIYSQQIESFTHSNIFCGFS